MRTFALRTNHTFSMSVAYISNTSGRRLNIFQHFAIFLVDATVAVFIFQIVALLLSYFYFLPVFPGIWFVWIAYYIISYCKYRQTLGQAFFHAGITVTNEKLPTFARIVFREPFTTFPGMMLLTFGWGYISIFRSLPLLLCCLILLCFRKRLFGITIRRREISTSLNITRRRKPGYIYLALIVAAIAARLINITVSNNSATILSSLLQATPRPTPHSVKNYVDFLTDNRMDINDYIMALFEEYDHVILCERHHREMTQYDMIYDLVTDKRFVDSIGVIFTEIGCVESRDAYKELTASSYANDTLVEKALASFMPDNQSVHLLWPNTNWFNFLKRMYYFNHGKDRKVDIMFADRNWIDNRDLLDSRDSIMADNIISTILADSLLKSLIIMNYRHAYLTPGNCGYYVARMFSGKVANVMINFGTVDLQSLLKSDEVLKPLQHGKWDVAFRLMNDSAFAFDFKDSPFGKDRFDHFVIPINPVNAKSYEEMFNGFIYYTALDDQYTSIGYNYIFEPENEAKLKIREDALKGYSLSYWDFLRDGVVVTDLKDAYNKINRRENMIFICICVLAILLDSILSLTYRTNR